ncbi:MAG: DUF4105 domain-containing protein [Sphaerochaetaceae bacterium]|nr:DUF4105 domain-containing protein [Sphaerochaetaceae bacterium]
MKKKILTILIFLLVSISAYCASIIGNMPEDPFPSEENLAQFDFDSGDKSYSEYQFNLLMTDKGEKLYTHFGHCGLEVITPRGSHYVCDWGVFYFTNGFYYNFVRGRLFYLMKISTLNRSLRKSEIEKRSLLRLPLNIPDQAKENLVKFLDYNNLPEKNTYLYDMYYDNCSTRIRDLYNATTGGDFKAWAEKQDTGLTLRQVSNSYLIDKPLEFWVLNYLQGNKVDKRANRYDAMLVPFCLEDAIADYQNNSSEFITSYEAHDSKIKYHPILPSLVAIILSSIFVFLFKKSRRAWAILMFLFSLVLTILSLVLTFFMFFSLHWYTYFNENYIVLNPTIIIILMTSLLTIFRKNRNLYKAKRYFLLFSFVSVLLLIIKLILPGIFYQDNLEIIIPILIFFISQSYALRKEKPHS